MRKEPACLGCCNCYFCEMLKLQKNSLLLLCLIGALLVSSCEGLFNKEEEKEPLARVGDTYLYKDDIASLISDDMSEQDSTLFVTDYINNWASKQLLLSKSKINLPEEKLAEFDRLVSNYRADLYTRAYIVQLRFVGMPEQFLDKDQVKARIRDWKQSDKKYLDSIAVQFKKMHFNDSIWVSASRVIEEIPPLTPANEGDYLKKSQFFELQDSLEVYLGMVTNVLEVNDTAPFEYIAPDIRQLILNRRRLDYVKKLETEIIDEAIKKKEDEVYEKNK